MIHYFIASQKLSMSEPFGEFVKKYDARGKKKHVTSTVAKQVS